MADFNKYDRNYEAFPTGALRSGMSRAEIDALFGANVYAVSGSGSGEVLAVDRWVAVAGPDYIGQRLYLKIEGGKLAAWKVEDAATISVVPRSW